MLSLCQRMQQVGEMATLVSLYLAFKFSLAKESRLTSTVLTKVSVAFIYREARFGSETISQTYLAENLQVLGEEKDWLHVRQEDGYEGWIASFFVVEKPELWDDYDFFSPASQISWVYQNPDTQSSTIRDMTILSSLPVLGHSAGWVQVLLPDGFKGWVEDIPGHTRKSLDVEQLIRTASSFLGIQYFWGGKTPKGFDCSGFVQTCFHLNGIELPRDAHQQAEIGQRLSDDYRTWQAGDLIFFSERPEKITHVAISLGDGDYIHASGYVKINSLNQDHADLYLDKYLKIFTRTVRPF
jgi:gamma-D-glutamyl-L-lysine dipeptidyl-peptidase